MRGTGAVTVGRDVVYAYFTITGRVARLRLSADECDRLDLFKGRQAVVGFVGGEPAGALVTSVTHAPPFAWVELEFAAEVRTARAG